MAHCTLNELDDIVCEEPGKNSIIIKGVNVVSLLEFAQNKHLLHLDPTDLLIIHDWVAVNDVIKEVHPGND